MKRVIVLIVVLNVVLMLMTPVAWSQDNTTPPAQKENEVEKPVSETDGITLPDDDTISFMRSFLALTFVLGLIFLSAYLYKKMTGIRTGMRSNRVAINMVGNLPLGDKRFMAVIEIHGKLFLVGITPNSIEMLSELDIDLPEGTMATAENDGDFENIFKKARTLLQKGQRK